MQGESCRGGRSGGRPDCRVRLWCRCFGTRPVPPRNGLTPDRPGPRPPSAPAGPEPELSSDDVTRPAAPPAGYREPTTAGSSDRVAHADHRRISDSGHSRWRSSTPTGCLLPASAGMVLIARPDAARSVSGPSRTLHPPCPSPFHAAAATATADRHPEWASARGSQVTRATRGTAGIHSLRSLRLEPPRRLTPGSAPGTSSFRTLSRPWRRSPGSPVSRGTPPGPLCCNEQPEAEEMITDEVRVPGHWSTCSSGTWTRQGPSISVRVPVVWRATRAGPRGGLWRCPSPRLAEVRDTARSLRSDFRRGRRQRGKACSRARRGSGGHNDGVAYISIHTEREDDRCSGRLFPYSRGFAGSPATWHVRWPLDVRRVCSG